MSQTASHNSDQGNPQQQINAVEPEEMNGGANEVNDTATGQSDTEKRRIQIEEHKRLFTEQMNAVLASKTGQQHGFMSEQKYNDVIETLQLWESMPVRDRRNFQEGYRYARKYFLLTRNGGNHELFSKKANEDGRFPSVVHLGNAFDYIRAAHTAVNHAKGRTLQNLLREKHGKSVPAWMRKLFTDLCPTCIEIREVRKHQQAGHRPILSKAYGERGQADLVDFQAVEFEGYKYLLVFQDHLTKFVDCLPLRDKRKATVARALLKIFTTLGAPKILHTDNGREFTRLGDETRTMISEPIDVANVITEMRQIWPACRMVHGRPRHSQSQGSVERANRKFRENIRAWLITNGNTACKDDWPTAALFAKWTINTSYHSGIRNKPYKLVFGQNPICGIMNLPLLSEEIAESLRTEEDVALHYGAELNVPLEEVRPNVIDVSHMIRNSDPAAQLDTSERDRRRGTQPFEPNHTSSPIGDEGRDDSSPSALIKFCDTCRRRIYAPGDGPSSTHLATGEDEAMCTCTQTGREGCTKGALEEASDDEWGSGGNSTTHVVRQNTFTHASDDFVAGSLQGGEMENVGSDNSVDEPSAEAKEQRAGDDRPSAGEQELKIDDREPSGEDDEPIAGLEVSPGRTVARENASAALVRQGRKMKKMAAKSQGNLSELRPGIVAKVNVSDFDRLKIDASTLTVVVVEKTPKDMYRLACKGGVLSRCFDRAYIVVLTGVSPELVDLRYEFVHWRELPRISMRQACMRKGVAANSRLRCSCTGNCITRRCSCKRAGLLCKSSCHRGNTVCCNRS